MSSLDLPPGATLDAVQLSSASTDCAIHDETSLVNYDMEQLRRALDPGENRRTDGLLLRLPVELLEGLLDALPARDIRNCALVCSYLAPLARSRTLRSFAIRDVSSLVRGVWFVRYAPELYRGTRKLTMDGSLSIGGLRQTKVSRLNLEPFADAISTGLVPSMSTDAEAECSFSEIVAKLEHVDILWLDWIRDWSGFYLFANKLLASPCMASITSLTMMGCVFQSVGALYDFLALFPNLAYIWMDESELMTRNKEASLPPCTTIPLKLIRCSGSDQSHEMARTLTHCSTPGSLREISFNAELGDLASLLLQDGLHHTLHAIKFVNGVNEMFIHVLNTICPSIEQLTFSCGYFSGIKKAEELRALFGNISHLTLPHLRCISIHIRDLFHASTITDQTLAAMAQILGDLGLKCLSVRFFKPFVVTLAGDSRVVSHSSRERVLRYTGANVKTIWRDVVGLQGMLDLRLDQDVEWCIETPEGQGDWHPGPELIHFRRQGRDCTCYMSYYAR